MRIAVVFQSFAPAGAGSFHSFFPRLTPWAAVFRRFAAVERGYSWFPVNSLLTLHGSGRPRLHYFLEQGALLPVWGDFEVLVGQLRGNSSARGAVEEADLD